MIHLLQEIFLGEEIWFPAAAGFMLALIIQIIINKVAGPTVVGRVVCREGYVDLTVWAVFILCFLWSLGRQFIVWIY